MQIDTIRMRGALLALGLAACATAGAQDIV